MAFFRATVALASIATTITAPILLLALCSAALLAVFFSNFAIFALVSDHLRNFCFYSWASLLVLPSLLRLLILLTLSPLVTSLGGLGCSPPSSARRSASIITTLQSFNKYPPLAASIGYPPPNCSRLYKGGYIQCFYYHIIICQFAALFPLVTSQAWLRSDILEPHPGVNCWREPYVPGSGCSGQVSSGSFRFPP